MLRRFLLTLGFLSRLAPARVADESDMRRLMFHLPLCGLVIGLIAAAPALLGLFSGRPRIQAWTVVVLSAYLTRGLHLDGLSDVMDGAGQHTDPARFWTIVKDSRAGTFGVVAVVLTLLGQWTLLTDILTRLPGWADPLGRLWPLPWIFCFGRACGVCLGRAGRRLARPGLGGLFLAGAGAPAVAWALVLGLGPALILAPLAALYAVLAALLLLLPLFRLARAVAGLNGDFLGASIMLGELAAAMGLVLATAG